MEKILKASLQPQNKCILLEVYGDVVQDNIEQFKNDLAEASAIIVDEYHAHNKPLHVLLDMTNFTGNYCLEALSLFTGFAKTNKSFIERTASFGGSDKVKMAGEIVITLSGRDNIKIFNTKEEALNWLK
jgi:hypothetical protein